ncbi:MAG TPA: cytochrome c3 family protein [Candidatus Eisenbacteria bacterium]
MSRARWLLAVAAAGMTWLAAPATAPAQATDSTKAVAPARDAAADSTRAAAPAPEAPATTHRAAAKALRIIPAADLASAAPGTMCGVCHSDIRVEFDRGIHHTERIGCASCHGGDPNATTVEAAHRGGFRGVPRRRDIPTLCASCHSDVARMRGYNLPSDQYALYQTSRHGQLLAKGDEHVAVCTDCHGAHEIRPPDDPKSSVFARNIPTTCGRCHGDLALMRRYGIKQDVAADYKLGVHGKAFLEGGNSAAPECTRCHGSHGATPPGIGDVEKVCGQCHGTVRSYFLAGPHKAGMDKADEPECAACHDHHKTKPATVAMLDTVCLECHDQGSKEVKLAATFKTMAVEASDRIDGAERLVEEAARIPLYVDDYKSRLTDARTALLEAYPVMHALDAAQVEPHTRRARSIAEQVSKEIHDKIAERRWRIAGLGLFWFYLLVTAGIILRARRRAAAAAEGRS